MFCGVLSHFNNDNLNAEYIHELEDYFDFYWKNNKLNFIKDPQDLQMLRELPVNYRVLILKEFLFNEFFYHFKRYFEFARPPKPNIRHAYFKWGDHDYDDFMLLLL